MPDTRAGGLTVLIDHPVSDERLEQLRAAAPGAVIECFEDRPAMAHHVGRADVIAGSINADALARAGKLRWIHSWAAGPDGDLYPEMVASPVVMTSSKSNGAVPLAEHAILLMQMLSRDVLRWIRAQEEHRWDWFVTRELQGLTCGIIGLGFSGQDLALKAQAFHMRVIGIRRSPVETPNVDEMFTRDRLHEFLRQSDFVVVTAPRTSETIGMLGEAEFRSMKPTAYFICFSRGGIADDGALLRALNEEWIAGAGLDAHNNEPLEPDSPFWTAKNTIVTPHNGASSAQTSPRGMDIFAENLRRFAAGEKLVNVVDKQVGY